MKKRNNSYIRFNYKFLPFVWIRTSRSIAVWSAKQDLYIDVIIGAKP